MSTRLPRLFWVVPGNLGDNFSQCHSNKQEELIDTHKATLEYLINVYDQLSVYGGNLGLDTHRVGI